MADRISTVDFIDRDELWKSSKYFENPVTLVIGSSQVREMSDGIIVLSPVELTTQFQMSANKVSMMDESIKNIKEGKVDLYFKQDEEKDRLSETSRAFLKMVRMLGLKVRFPEQKGDDAHPTIQMIAQKLMG